MLYNIKDKVYKNGFMCYLEYQIKGIRTYSDSVVYEAECLSCTHGSNCMVLLCETNGKLEFAGMIDDDEDQHYTHNMEGLYYKTLEGAKRARLQTLVYEKKKLIEDLQKRLKDEEKRLFELNDALSLVKDAK